MCYCVGALLIELATIKETAFIGAYIDVSVCRVFVYSCFAMAVLALKSSLFTPTYFGNNFHEEGVFNVL